MCSIMPIHRVLDESLYKDIDQMAPRLNVQTLQFYVCMYVVLQPFSGVLQFCSYICVLIFNITHYPASQSPVILLALTNL